MKKVIIWFITCTIMILHSFFEVLRDGNFYSENIKKLVVVDWHIIKIIALVSLTIAAILIWLFYRTNWKFIISILLLKWGSYEFFWNILDDQYVKTSHFMALSLRTSIIIIVISCTIPLFLNYFLTKLNFRKSK